MEQALRPRPCALTNCSVRVAAILSHAVKWSNPRLLPDRYLRTQNATSRWLLSRREARFTLVLAANDGPFRGPHSCQLCAQRSTTWRHEMTIRKCGVGGFTAL